MHLSNWMSDLNKRVIVIDDDESVRTSFAQVLCPKPKQHATALADLEAELFGDFDDPPPQARETFQVDFASQGLEGLSMIESARASEKPYALAFVDMRMPPGIDGLETIRRIFAGDSQLDVVLCTAYSDHTWDEVRAAAGYSERLKFVRKPFDVAKIIEVASDSTERWASRNAS